LINTGCPAAPTISAIRSFYREFLMDGRVLDLRWPLRFLLVQGIIAPLRPYRMLDAYRQIARPQGEPMPLLHHSRELEMALQKRMDLPLHVVMRLGEENIVRGLARLQEAGVREVTVLPLFPQYADATTGSVLEECYRALSRMPFPLAIRVTQDFFSHPAYIAALADSIQRDPRALACDRIIASFHGLPERYLKKGRPGCLTPGCCTVAAAAQGCYRAQCVQTAALLSQRLGRPVDLAFQSRFGREVWTTPALFDVLEKAASRGESVAVVAPSFVADCLETLYEIDIELREMYESIPGHGRMHYVPCLNADEGFVNALAEILGPFETSGK